MCGIAGILSYNNKLPNVDVLHSMAARLHHRGPDAEGFYTDAGLGFAHRRLSIIDIDGGAQPMQTADGDLVVTFNGEIFNYVELRAQLQHKGYIFHSQSDTEVILHLYREYGLDFPNHCNGQFAIGLWDKRERKLILVRDRVGICPLYYSRESEQFVFASEVKALQPAMSSSLALDRQSLDHLFTGWTCLPPKTIFQGVSQVAPGELLVTDASGDIHRQQYWDLRFPCHRDDYDNRNVDTLTESLHQHLLDATSLRLRADVPVGAYLSGGLDSSVLVALMARRSDVDLHTFSLGFADPGLDETPFQQQVVAHLGTQHKQIAVDNAHIAQQLPETIWHTESPLLRTAPAPMGMLSGLVNQQGYKVVLTGEGADEILGGYDIFKEAKVRQFWARQPHSTWRPLLLKRLYPYLSLPKANAAVYLQRFFGVGLDAPNLPWHSHLPRWQTTAKAKLFFSAELKQTLAESVNYEQALAQRMPAQMSDWHWFNRAQYLEIKTLMAGYLLTSQGDRMLSQHSVEGRFPYLDHHLIEFANRLPPTFKMKVLNEKYLLKKIAREYLPETIMARHKQPYRAPDVAALAQPRIPDYVKELLSAAAIKKTGYFNPLGVGKLLQKLAAGRLVSNSDSQALVGILTTQLCHYLFVENTPYKAFTV